MDSLGEPQHVDGSDDAGLNGLDRIVLVVNRRRGTGQIIDLINFEQDRFNHVVTLEFKPRIAQEVRDIFAPSGEEVVETDHFVLFGQQAFAKVRTQEACASSDQDSQIFRGLNRHIKGPCRDSWLRGHGSVR